MFFVEFGMFQHPLFGTTYITLPEADNKRKPKFSTAGSVSFFHVLPMSDDRNIPSERPHIKYLPICLMDKIYDEDLSKPILFINELLKEG